VKLNSILNAVAITVSTFILSIHVNNDIGKVILMAVTHYRNHNWTPL